MIVLIFLSKILKEDSGSKFCPSCSETSWHSSGCPGVLKGSEMGYEPLEKAKTSAILIYFIRSTREATTR